MTDAALAWAAGLFEGEGCITLSRVGGRVYLSLSISMHGRDRDVLDRFAGVVGVGAVAGPHKNGMCRWSATGMPAQRLASEPRFTTQLGERRAARLRECLDAVATQPPAMTRQETGRLAGLASGRSRQAARKQKEVA